MASSSLRIPLSIRCLHHKEPLFQSHPRSSTRLLLPRRPSPSPPLLTFARRRHDLTPKTPNKNKKKVEKPDVEENDDLDEDAFEALFQMLEEDLKNDELSLDDDAFDDISEEDLKKLEEELEEALKDDELLAAFGSNVESQVEEEIELDQEDENNKEMEDKEEEHLRDGNDEGANLPQLKTWQLRRLAQAMKKGRRKISIKNLAADLCLDRAIVLNLLREPPPSLLMLSAALPDEPATPLEPVTEATEPVILEVESAPLEQASDDTKLGETENVPVHARQRNWSAQKRLKKVQLETLESVYGRTKRPTNTMISSIVHVTNLPRKKVVKWFEDKRTEEGVPSHRLPYQPSTAETSNTQ